MKTVYIYLGEVSSMDHHQPISDDDESNQQYICDGSGVSISNENSATAPGGSGGSGDVGGIGDGGVAADGCDDNNVIMQDSVVG